MTPPHAPASDLSVGYDAPASFAAAAPIADSGVPASTPRSLVIPDGELIILRIKPSLWMIIAGLWPFLILGGALSLNVLAYVPFLAGVTTRLPYFNWSLTHAFVRLGSAMIFFTLAGVAWRFLAWWHTTYVLTDRRLIIQSGVLRQTIIDAPLRRIQHVSLHRGVEQRALATGTLLFSTAGPFGEFAWFMISRPLERLRVVRDAIERYGRNGPNGCGAASTD